MELGRASWRLCALAFPSRNPDLKAACLRAPALTLLITLMFSPVNYTNTAGLTGENAHLALGRGVRGEGACTGGHGRERGSIQSRSISSGRADVQRVGSVGVCCRLARERFGFYLMR